MNGRTVNILFKAAGIGAVIKGIDGITDALGSAAKFTKDLAVDAIKVGAAFEATQFGLAAVVGGMKTASQELQAIDKIAQNTPGLRLKSAEEGYQQLRNLGFEAQFAQRAIKALGTQRLLSNADNAAIERVIVNFTQLANGSQRASADLNQIIHAMPSLKNAFIDAFGTLDTKKIATQFKDPQEALEKLITSMEKTAKVAGGTANAYEVLTDQAVLSQRIFAKPTLEPTTKAFDALTKILKDNSDTFESWGKTTGQVITAVTSGIQVVGNFASSSLGQVALKLAEIAAYATNPLINLLVQYGKLEDAKNKFLANLDPNDDELEKYYSGIEEKENVATLKRLAKEAADAQERERIAQDSRDKIDSIHKKSFSNLEKYYKIHSAEIENTITTTFNEQYAQQRASYNLEQDYLKRRYSGLVNFYNQKYQLAQTDKEREKVSAESSDALGDVEAQYRINQFKAAKMAEELRRQEVERVRGVALESQSLYSGDASSFLGINIEKLNEKLDQRNVLISDYNSQAVKLTNDMYDRMANAAAESQRLELSLIGIQEDEKANIRQKYAQSAAEREEARRKALNQIQRNADKESIAQLQEGFQRRTQIQDNFTKNLQLQYQLNAALLGQYGFDTKKFADSNKQDVGLYSLTTNQRGALNRYGSTIDDANRLPQDKIELNRITSSYTSQTEDFQQRRDDLNKTIDFYKKAATTEIAYKNEIASAEHELTLVTQEETGARLQYNLDYATKYAQTVDGIKEKIASIRSGAPQALIDINDKAQKQIASQTLSTLEQIRVAELSLIPTAEEVAERRKLAYLSALNDIVHAEENAIQRIDAAQLQLAHSMEISNNQIKARVLEGLASQKTLNESIADGILDTYDKVAERLDENIDKMFKWAGAFSSLFTEPFKAMQRSSLTKITTNLLDAVFPGMGSQLEYDKNPLLGEAKKTNDKLDQIIKNTGGTVSILSGSSPGSTLPSSGSIGKALGSGGIIGAIGSILGLGKAGSGTTAPFNPNSGSGLSTSDIGSIFAGGASSGAASGSIWSKITGKGGILGDAGFGNNNGTYGAIGAGAGLLGSLIGGRAGNALSYAGTGLATGAQIGTAILPGIGTAIGAAAGAIAGGLYGLISNPQRGKDEETRTAAYQSVLQTFDGMILQLKAIPPRLDPIDAQIRANQVISEYSSAMSQLSDKKTRDIALKEVKDGIIYRKNLELQAAIKIASENQAMIKKNAGFAGQFAEGGYFSSDFASQYEGFKRYNGLLSGTYDAKDTIRALVGKGEMILNPKQVHNVRKNAGFDVFEGAGIPRYQPKAQMPTFAGGASLDTSSFTPSLGAPTINLTFGDITIGAGNDVDAEGVKRAIEEAMSSRLFTEEWKKRKQNWDRGRWV